MNIEGQTDLGQWGYGGPLAVPRQWDFLDDGSILDVFIADRATLTHRLYSHRGGQAALEFRDTSGTVSNLRVRRLE